MYTSAKTIVNDKFTFIYLTVVFSEHLELRRSSFNKILGVALHFVIFAFIDPDSGLISFQHRYRLSHTPVLEMSLQHS